MNQDKTIPELLEFSIINVDKPAGITSFVCADRVRKIFNAKKTGHFGTLDLRVTGVLPVTLNRACRLSNYFIKKDKEYIGKMLLHKDISEEELKKLMDNFIGKIMQKPPVRSSVKRVLRERIVNKFRIIKKEGRVVEFDCDVSAGTYIRKLISDLGEKIGGAHMISLRRIRAGIFTEKVSFKLEDIQDVYNEYKKGNELKLRKILIPAEIIEEILPRVNVKDESMKKLLNGKPLMDDDLQDILSIDENNSNFSVFNSNRFIGIYKKIKDDKKGDIIAIPEFILD
jgi:H/ACA ribonucleoprotein complex subunit 4